MSLKRCGCVFAMKKTPLRETELLVGRLQLVVICKAFTVTWATLGGLVRHVPDGHPSGQWGGNLVRIHLPRDSFRSFGA